MEKQRTDTHFSGKPKGLVFGLLLIIAGILFLSFNFGWLDPALRGVIFSWPMVIIVLGLMRFSIRDPWASLFLLGIGIFFLLPRIAMAYPESISGLDAEFATRYWPFLLIVIGLAVIWRAFSRKRRISTRNQNFPVDSLTNVDGLIDKRVFFGGSKSIFLDPVFNGGVLSATFGGIQLDLRRTSLPEGETILYVDATFGGIELNVPGDWLVETRIQTIMGGVEDKRMVATPIENRKLILRGEMIFGGCELH